ncbi:MAG: hypothetical protein IT310_03025 [Anaerolineales bacterium]|nr:hypothetical protein [Anaerolineales bacterium]
MEFINIVLIIFGGGLVFCSLGYITFRWMLRKGWVSLRLMAFSAAIMYLALGVVFLEVIPALFSAVLAVVSVLSILLMPKINPSLWEILKLAGVKW